MIQCLETSLLLIQKDVFASRPNDSSYIKIGINGFGPIGRLIFRCALEEGIEVVAIIDPTITVGSMIYRFKYDSTYNQFKDNVSYKDGIFIVNEQEIHIFTEKEPSKIPWNQVGAEYIVESTGRFTTIDKCQLHLHAGAKKVIITSSSSDVPMFVMGVNEDRYTGEETIISNPSSTINCLAPLAKIIHEKFGIKQALIITIHSYTYTEKLIAESSNKDGKCGRETAQYSIPSSIDLVTIIGKIIPDLNGKLTNMIVPVPIPNISVVHLIVWLEKNTNYKAICATIKEAVYGPSINILDYIDDKVILTNSIDNTHSSIFDGKSGISFNNNFVRLVLWYDNEYGYANRIIDLIKYIANKDFENQP